MIVGKVKSNYKPLIMAVFLVIGGLASGSFFLGKNLGKLGVAEVQGPLSDSSSIAPQSAIIVNVAQGAEVVDPGISAEKSDQESVNEDHSGNDLSFAENFFPVGAVQDPGEPIGQPLAPSGAIAYKVQQGDTLSSLATAFGISANSIISQNSAIRKKSVKPGEILNILPASEVIYHTQAGDTLSSIASQFNIPQKQLIQFNQSLNFASLSSGAAIIIPGGMSANLAAAENNTLPNLDSDFIMPAQGYNLGILDNDNGVDITNACGTPVVASADGVVVPDANIPDVAGGWNGGYGNFVLLKHTFGNDIYTRYAHLQQVLVQIGDYVKQGQEIGLMGKSGDSTGCHVHFEVIGAQNPFIKS